MLERHFFAGGAVFGEVTVSLFLEGAAFGKIWNDGRGTKCFLHPKCSSKAGKVTSAGGSFAHQCQICRAVFGEVDVMLARHISWQTCGVCVCVLYVACCLLCEHTQGGPNFAGKKPILPDEQPFLGSAHLLGLGCRR